MSSLSLYSNVLILVYQKTRMEIIGLVRKAVIKKRGM